MSEDPALKRYNRFYIIGMAVLVVIVLLLLATHPSFTRIRNIVLAVIVMAIIYWFIQHRKSSYNINDILNISSEQFYVATSGKSSSAKQFLDVIKLSESMYVVYDTIQMISLTIDMGTRQVLGSHKISAYQRDRLYEKNASQQALLQFTQYKDKAQFEELKKRLIDV